MKRLLVIAAALAATLTSRAQGTHAAMDARTTAYRQNVAKVEDNARKLRAAWPDQYLQALKALDLKFKAAGDLDNVILVRKEIDRFNQTKQVSRETAPQTPAELGDLHTRAMKSLQSIDLSSGRQIAALTSSYVADLDLLKKELTRQGKFDDAIQVSEALRLARSSAAEARAQLASLGDGPIAPVKETTNARPTSPKPAAVAKATRAVAARPKTGTTPIGAWSTYPPGLPDVKLTMTLHEDGRFEQSSEDAEWDGTFIFLNDERTKVERRCNNGSTFILEYDRATDSMTQNDGAPYSRISG
jgi:hypothetical protein